MGWDEKSEALLRELVRHKTWEEIGKRFGISADAARWKARQLGLEKKILNQADPKRDLMLMKYSEEHGVRKTCEHYSVTKDEVCNARRRVRARRQRARELMTPQFFVAFRNSCLRYAATQSPEFEPEDFASWAVSSILEGAAVRKVRKFFLDYCRTKNGRSESVNYEKRRNLTRAEEPERMPGITPEYVSKTSLFQVVDRMKLSVEERVVFLLYFREHLALHEIGAYLGVTESRACQILTIVKDLLAKNIEAKEILDGMA